MFIPENEREGRKQALSELRSAMSQNVAKRLGGRKKIGVEEIEMQGMPEEERGMEGDDDSMDHLSPEEVTQVRDLLRKMRK